MHWDDFFMTWRFSLSNKMQWIAQSYCLQKAVPAMSSSCTLLGGRVRLALCLLSLCTRNNLHPGSASSLCVRWKVQAQICCVWWCTACVSSCCCAGSCTWARCSVSWAWIWSLGLWRQAACSQLNSGGSWHRGWNPAFLEAGRSQLQNAFSEGLLIRLIWKTYHNEFPFPDEMCGDLIHWSRRLTAVLSLCSLDYLY